MSQFDPRRILLDTFAGRDYSGVLSSAQQRSKLPNLRETQRRLLADGWRRGATATIHAKSNHGPQWSAVKLALGAALNAATLGDAIETIGHCEVAKAACIELAAPSPPAAQVVEPDEPLGIAAVMVLTGYSKSALRRKGKDLPGYHKYPNGKVVWWKRQLVQGLQGAPP